MRVGRHIGAAARRLPGVGALVDRLRFVLRVSRRSRRHWRDGGPKRRYARWVRAQGTSSAVDLRSRASRLGNGPVISLILIPEPQDAFLLDRAIASIRAQAFPAWELCVVTSGKAATLSAAVRRHAAEDSRVRLVHGDPALTGGAARNVALAATTGEFVAVIDAGDVLPPESLVEIAEASERHPHAGLIYADEDRIDTRGQRSDPWFKCDCNRELLLTHDAISRLAVYSRRLVQELGGWREEFAGAEDHDLALRTVEAVGPARVVHVPRILCHRGAMKGGADASTAVESGRRAVRDLLQSRRHDAVVEAAPEAAGRHRVRHALPSVPPLVSIIICTRDHERLIRAAIDSITNRTTYPRYELVIVDNGSVEPRAVAYLAELAGRPDVRVLRDDGPFNYSRLNNRAAAVAHGEVLCLLNDDVEVLTPGWLEELVSFAVQPDIGAVGARLWYPDGTLQHGGVIVGIGRDAGHAHPRLERGNPGYHDRAVLQQEFSAVTAACLAVRAEVFAAVSGFDERLSVAFNDVDFCLRLREAGYRTIWTPYAELVHHESASRGVDDTPAKRSRAQREVELLRDRWGESLRNDPFYNPNLSHAVADFSVDAPADPSSTRQRLCSPGSWLWSLLLAAAVVVPAAQRIVSPPRTCVLDVTLLAGRNGAAELFYDVGRGYNGDDMSRAEFVAGEPQVISLSLPDGFYPTIRLDPTTCRDEVIIDSLALRNVATGTRRDVPLTALRAWGSSARVRLDGDRARVTSESDDPILFIELAEPLRVGSGVRPWPVARLCGVFLLTTAVIGGVGTLGRVLTRRRSPAVRRAAGVAALGCLLAAPRLVAIGQPLLDFHDFRQTQTALTAYWFAAEGPTLPAYPLPVLGRPWTAPFEFPLYQLFAAALHWLGVPLDAACRGTALVAFIAAILLLDGVLRRHGAPRLLTGAVRLFALSAPFALVWSKAALIEFTAVFFGMAFAGLAVAAHAAGLTIVQWLLLTAAGAAAALTKITTFAVFWPAGALLAADRLWRMSRERVGPRRLLVCAVAWAVALAVPLAVGQAWVEVTDAVKSQSETTAPLMSGNLRDWNFGTLDQRLDYRTWRVILQRIGDDVLPYVWPLAIYGAFVLPWLPRRIALLGFGMLAGACGAVTLFFNLYVVHDYYLCAIVVPLWVAAAAGLYGIAERLRRFGMRRLVLPAVLAIMIIAAARSFVVRQSYGDFSGDPFLTFCREVRDSVPEDAEVLVIGDDWNPRVPYYTQRKALMAWKALPASVISEYVVKNGVRDVIVRRTGDVSTLRFLPESERVMQLNAFELRRLRPPRPR